MADEQQTFEEGPRRGMRMAALTGEIQVVEATVLDMLDHYRALIPSRAAPISVADRRPDEMPPRK